MPHYRKSCGPPFPAVAVCCNVIECVAVCRSVSQCVAVCCSVLQLCDTVANLAEWLVEILKSQLAAEFFILNDYTADF